VKHTTLAWIHGYSPTVSVDGGEKWHVGQLDFEFFIFVMMLPFFKVIGFEDQNFEVWEQ